MSLRTLWPFRNMYPTLVKFILTSNLTSHPLEVAQDQATDALRHVSRCVEPGSMDAAPTVSAVRPLNAVMPQGSVRTVQTAEIAEVEAIQAEQGLTALRSLRTFSYAVELLLHRAEMAYYITLKHDGKLWRALQATDLESAEAAFGHFEGQAIRLADVELRRALLEAHNQQIATRIEAAERQAERLRVDLEHHSEQTQMVNNWQQEVRKDVVHLEAQRVAAQARLNKIGRLIHQLRTTSNERVPPLRLRRSEGS